MVGRRTKGTIVISRRAPNFDVDSEACRWIDRRNNTGRFLNDSGYCDAGLRPSVKIECRIKTNIKAIPSYFPSVRIVTLAKRTSHINRTVQIFFLFDSNNI